MNRLILLIMLLPMNVFSQNYTSYFTGNVNNIVTSPLGGICLMGGATEDDNAMKWFLQKANGGDVLVLRTSGSNGYNTYLYSTLGITVNSVETIVCNNPAASSDAYVLQKIQQAEAIWFAGGDQWTYVSYWRNTPVETYVNQAIQQRNIVIGGTSAGMAIQGRFYFSAQNGTVTSAAALANPFNSLVTVDSVSFIQNNILSNVITDTHFDNPDRRGRLSTFLARISNDYGVLGKAIACDEYTAVCINTNGIASVYGGYPTYDDNAYFIQTNCELPSQIPETCTNATPLTWYLNGKALRVYRIKGNATGSNTFDLNNWTTGVGGQWLDWSVSNGVFSEINGIGINCTMASVNENDTDLLSVFPNPACGKVTISCPDYNISKSQIIVYNTMGQLSILQDNESTDDLIEIDLGPLPIGIYYLTVLTDNGKRYNKRIIKN